ncbi:MAG TPA: DUF72 domain-containing protein [Gemmataceae bacterium]|nr:DUF72 domain-containing protein [Gemmataceae bacterium]
MTLYVGTSGYSYPKWKGSFYPEKLPNKQMLRYYGEQFRAVESNYTFRGTPDPSVFEGWAAEVPAGFTFALKAPQRITHMKRLKDVADPVAEFLRAAAVLKKRLGPLFFQLPPNFKKDVPRLRDLLALVPRRFRVALEFRHPSWFDEEVFGVLRKHRVALCIADTDELDVPFVATADWGYLRLRRSNYSAKGLKSWANRIRAESWRDAFVFFRHEDEGRGPRLAKQLEQLAG